MRIFCVFCLHIFYSPHRLICQMPICYETKKTVKRMTKMTFHHNIFSVAKREKNNQLKQKTLNVFEKSVEPLYRCDNFQLKNKSINGAYHHQSLHSQNKCSFSIEKKKTKEISRPQLSHGRNKIFATKRSV